MSSRICRLFCLALSLPVMTGCATLTASSHETLTVYSNPPAAEIRVNGQVRGTTPADIQISKENPESVDVSLPGFLPYSCSTRLSAGTGYIVADSALCLFLFPFGCISFIDATGNWNTLDSSICSANLQPLHPGGHPSNYPQPNSGPWGGYQPGAMPQPAHPVHPASHPAPPPQAAPAHPPAPQPPPNLTAPPLPLPPPPPPPPAY